jgi:hypothetical protein
VRLRDVLASSASTSCGIGIDGAVPGRVTENAGDGAGEADRLQRFHLQ